MNKATVHLAAVYTQAISFLMTIAAVTPYEQGTIADQFPVSWKPKILVGFGILTAVAQVVKAHTTPPTNQTP